MSYESPWDTEFRSGPIFFLAHLGTPQRPRKGRRGRRIRDPPEGLGKTPGDLGQKFELI